MRKKKANVWIVIIFLTITFLYTTIIDVRTVAGSFEAEIRSAQGEVISSTTNPATQKITLPENAIVYKQFKVSYSGTGDKLNFDISNRWLELNEVDAASVYVLVQNYENANWSTAPLTQGNTYALSTLYSTSLLSPQTYSIIGIKHSAPSQERFSTTDKTNIIIGIIIGLLIFAYYPEKKEFMRKKKLNNAMASLEGYVKKSMIEGHSEEEIKSALLASGWSEENVKNAIRRLRYY